MLSRRGFFGAIAALTVAPRRWLVPSASPVLIDLNDKLFLQQGLDRLHVWDGQTVRYVGGSFTFWRNHPDLAAFDHLGEARRG